MKRVVHVTSVHTPQDSRILHRECKWLAKSGYEVIFVVPAGFIKKKAGNVTLLGIKKPGSRFQRPLAWLRIIRKILRLRPDILQFHDPELLVILPVVRWFSPKKLKIVYDVHEYLLESIKDKFWIPLNLRKITAFFVSKLESFLGRWVDGQVFVSEGQTKYYSSWNIKKIVLYNYPDLDQFKIDFRKKQNPDKGFTLVHIGSLYERRGIMTMLEVLKRLKKENYNIHLILGGVFESLEFRNRVEAFIRENELEAAIDVLGWVDYSKIKDELLKSDAAWLAHFQQGISTKQLEAMLASLPIICSNIPSLERFVIEAGCGISVQVNDPDSHAAAIKYLYHNPVEGRKMGSRGRQLILEKYNWQNEVKKLNDFYAGLLK